MKVPEFRKFVSLTDDKKLLLLKALGYDKNSEGIVVHSSNKKPVFCKYSKEKVRFETASILPGSEIVINTSPITISQYIEEYLE